MFQKIRSRLLLSYLLVLTSILGIFAIAVRITFARSLSHQLIDKLTVLGESAAANAEFEEGKFKIGEDFSEKDLISRHQALQWFDIKGNLLSQQGKDILLLPFSPNETHQIQQQKTFIQGVTLPVIGNDNKQVIGYVRASQSLEEIEETLNKLDWGLGGGIVVTLVLSSLGGIWLTRQAMQPIEESFQRLKQFTADASHEFRSPLMVAKGNAEIALRYPEGIRENDIEKFQAILNSTNQMTRLTEDLLFLSRRDSLPDWNREIIDLNVILESLVQMYKFQAEAKQIDLKFEVNDTLTLLGDSVQLTRLFTNLIENALNYTPSGGVITIKSSQINSYFDINIQDTGIGIPPEHISKIFDRFWRADSSRYYANGSGLGLAIAQAIAQNHGGLITVSSQLEIGSCFTVRFSSNFSTIKTN